MKEKQQAKMDIQTERIEFTKADGGVVEVSVYEDVLERDDPQGLLLWAIVLQMGMLNQHLEIMTKVLTSIGAQDSATQGMVGEILKQLKEKSPGQEILEFLKHESQRGRERQASIHDQVKQAAGAVMSEMGRIPGMPSMGNQPNVSASQGAVEQKASLGETPLPAQPTD